MSSPRTGAARVLGALAAIVLAAYLALVAVAAFPHQVTADFYQFWGIAAAHKASSIEATPYSDPEAYARVLNAMADASASEKLPGANELRHELDPTGTPLFYATFTFFPRDYDTAQALFVVLLHACALAATFAIARLRGFGTIASICIAAGVGLVFTPFIVDVNVGNVNSLQLACIAAWLALASRRIPERRRLEIIAVGLLAVFVAYKPNTLLIAAGFATWYFLVARRSDFRIAAILAAALALTSWAVGAWYFGDASAWSEWMRYARRLAGVDPSIVFESGNQSLAMWLARHARSQAPGMFGLAIGFALAVAVIVAAAGPKREPARALAALRAAFADPFFATSFAVLLTFAMSPIVWIHYLVFALVPMLWLARGHGRIATIGAVIAFVAMARPTIDLLGAAGLARLIEPITLLSWLALVPGMLAFVSRSSKLCAISSRSPGDQWQ
jgi:hypothetical protein